MSRHRGGSWQERELRRATRWRRPRAWGSSALLALALAAAPATAQTGVTPEPRVQIARDLFERGKAKWSEGQYEEAAALLAASQQQVPNAGTAMLLADAHERLGRLRSARDAFRAAAELARQSGDRQLEYRANTREAALLPRLPQVEIRVPRPAPGGLLVTLDGRELSASELNVPIALDAGSYHVEARAPGHEPFALSVQLENDGAQQRGVRLVPVHLVPAGAGPAEPGSNASLAWWIGGAGGVLAAAGAVMMLVALDKNSSSKEHCGRNAAPPGADEDACTAEGARLREQARSLATWATVPGLLGIAGLGTGLVLHLDAGSGSEPRSAWVGWSSAF